MGDFLCGIAEVVQPGKARPVVVHADELEPLPPKGAQPEHAAVAGRLPTTTFEIFRQTIPAGLSSDMQRHYHETVHYVIAGAGHSEIEGGRCGQLLGGRRFRLHPALDLAPPLQRLGRRTRSSS